MLTSRSGLGAIGTTSAALGIAGHISSNTNTVEIYNGSSWATTSSMNTANDNLAVCGTTSDTLGMGGDPTDSNAGTTQTEKFNGTT